MNLSRLKNLVYRQEAIDCTVRDKKCCPPSENPFSITGKFGAYWEIVLEDERGKQYAFRTRGEPSFDDSKSEKINQYGNVRLEFGRIFGLALPNERIVRQ